MNVYKQNITIMAFSLENITSKIVYSLAVIDFTLLHIFFYRMSKLSQQELNNIEYIDISNFWMAYFVHTLFIIGVIYIYYVRYGAKPELSRHFNLKNELQEKVVANIATIIMPIVALTMMLYKTCEWLYLSS